MALTTGKTKMTKVPPHTFWNGFNASVQCVCRLCGTNSRQPVHHIWSKINVFAACAEPTPDNQYTTFKPTHELVHAAMRHHLLKCGTLGGVPWYLLSDLVSTTCVCRLRGTNSRQPAHHCLPLMRNHLLIPPHAFAAYAEPTPNTSTPPSRFHE